MLNILKTLSKDPVSNIRISVVRLFLSINNILPWPPYMDELISELMNDLNEDIYFLLSKLKLNESLQNNLESSIL